MTAVDVIRDALDELEKCLAGGAAALKCLPNVLGIDWNDRRHTRFLERMAEAGMPVAMADRDDLADYSAKLGIPAGLEGCHVGEMDGYVISGHVPPEDIKSLLAERPAARGLLVPGMPMGSPGMEMGDHKDRYDVLLLAADGTTSVFASHG